MLTSSAQARHVAADIARFPGLAATTGPVDMAALIRSKHALVESLRTAKYREVAETHGGITLMGEARFTGAPEAPLLDVASGGRVTEVIDAADYLVATGARPWVPPIEGLSQVAYLTSTTAMELAEVPESLLVLGGGSVALEQAQLLARLGSKVTVLARSRLASREEPEVSRALQQVFADEGIEVVLQAQVDNVANDPVNGRVVATATVAGRLGTYDADQVLIAMGRRPVTDGLNLEPVGVRVGTAGEILVNEHLRSSNPRIWAAGDVTGHRQFVYVAAHHGALVVDNAFSDARRTPNCTTCPGSPSPAPQWAPSA